MSQKVTVTISLDTRDDKDVLRWLDQQDNRSAAVRQAIRAYIERGGVSLADVYQAIQELKKRSFATAPTQGEDSDWPEEPAEAAAALDRLGEL